MTARAEMTCLRLVFLRLLILGLLELSFQFRFLFLVFHPSLNFPQEEND